MVPLRFSSANSRIVIMGTRNSSTMVMFPRVGSMTNWLTFIGGAPMPPCAPTVAL